MATHTRVSAQRIAAKESPHDIVEEVTPAVSSHAFHPHAPTMVTPLLDKPAPDKADIQHIADDPHWHPTPPKRRYGWVGWILAMAILGGGGYAVVRYDLISKIRPAKPAPAARNRVVPVVTATSHTGNLNVYINGLGTVTPFYTVTVRSRVEGEVTDVKFHEGELISEGDLLATIDPRPFEVQLKQAEGQLAKDEASLTVAQLDLERFQTLIASKTITQQQLDTQRGLVKQSEGAIKADQAMIDNAKLQLTYCKITAPISGRIGLRRIDPGNIVQANDPNGIAVITQLQPITVVFPIPQDEITRVQQKVNAGKELVVQAYDRTFQTKLATGTVSAIDNQVDPLTGTVRIKALFENEDHLLFPNQFVNVRLLIDTLNDVVLVPSAAIQRGHETNFVYVVGAESKVQMQNVALGPTEGDQTVIKSGLAAGTTVVTDGVDKLQQNTQVAVRDKKGSGKPGNDNSGKESATTSTAPKAPVEKLPVKGNHGAAHGRARSAEQSAPDSSEFAASRAHLPTSNELSAKADAALPPSPVRNPSLAKSAITKTTALHVSPPRTSFPDTSSPDTSSLKTSSSKSSALKRSPGKAFKSDSAFPSRAPRKAGPHP